MQTYQIEKQINSPEVFISREDGMIEIRGNSTLKDTNWFYSNVLKWALAFSSGPFQIETVNIKLTRINDSSAKWLTLIFKKLSQLLPKQNFEINWYYHKSGSRIERSGYKLKSESGLHVNMLIA